MGMVMGWRDGMGRRVYETGIPVYRGIFHIFIRLIGIKIDTYLPRQPITHTHLNSEKHNMGTCNAF